MTQILSIKSDTAGALASSLCLVHCLATPFLFMGQSMIMTSEAVPVWWQSLDFIFLFLSFLAVYWSVKNSTNQWVKSGLWVSLFALTFGLLNEKIGFFHLTEASIFIPAITLVALHLYNRKYCQCTDKGCCAN